MTNALKHLDELDALLAGATPGEWKAQPSEMGLVEWDVIDARGMFIAQAFQGAQAADQDKENGEENARLIAALKNDAPALIKIARLAQECADDLEAEVKNRWVSPDGSVHPALQRKFDRDMSVVIELRAALNLLGAK